MSIVRLSRGAVKKILFGDTLLPQEFSIALRGPQTEVRVWLHGMGAPRDVTHRQSTACSEPFAICIAFDEGRMPDARERERLSLKFCEGDGKRRVLGEIGLKPMEQVSPVGSEVLFFAARSASNYCLPRLRLGFHYLRQEYAMRRKVDTSGMKMSFLERRAAMVTFIRPHPTSVGSVVDEAGGNIFIMNLMGELGRGRFAFGLKDSRKPAHLVERVGRIAVSSAPFEQGRVVFQLAANHFKESIAWDQLPFATRRSAMFGFPIPEFALEVREMEVEAVRKIGSHTLFVARIVHAETFARDEELHVVHGFYQARRLRGCSGDEVAASVAADLVNKRGFYPVGDVK